MKISLIIPVYNALNEFKKLIKSIDKNFDFNFGEVIVVDDCSDLKTKKYIQTLNSNYKIITNNKNLGYIKSVNLGIKQANNQIIVLLNSDTVIPSRFNQKIINCFEKNSNIAVASPIRCDKFGFYYIKFPFWYSLEKMNRKLEKVFARYSKIPSAEGFCFCINKKIIDKIGLFDEEYGLGYHEEIDYSYRALQEGYENYLIEDLCVYHKRCCSFGNKKRLGLIKRNNALFNSRWEGFRQKYLKENNLFDPTERIKKELFPIKYNIKNLFARLLKNHYN